MTAPFSVRQHFASLPHSQRLQNVARYRVPHFISQPKLPIYPMILSDNRIGSQASSSRSYWTMTTCFSCPFFLFTAFHVEGV